MTPDESELELYTTALRGDLPQASDEARVRKLLAEAGVLAGSVAAPGMALGAATAGSGAAAKLAALPLAVKVGGALLVAGIVATPVVRHATSADSRSTNEVALTAQPVVRAALAPRSPAPRPEQPPTQELVPSPTAVAAPAALATAAARVETATSRTSSAAPRAGDAAARPTVEATPARQSSPASPAVMAFEVPSPNPPDEGTLRAETALIERALTALRRGDSATARRALAEHSARFPEGQLVRERERALAKVAEKETSHDSK